MRVKKTIGFIHLWLGLISGLIIFILGITGSILVFEDQLKDIFYSKRIFADTKSSKLLPLDTLKQIAQGAVGKDKVIGRVQIIPNSNRTYIFSAEGYNGDAILYTNQYTYSNKVYINPFTGKVQCLENTKWDFFMVVLSLHYDLMLGPIGHFIVPWATVIFVIMLITGIILWWPKNKSAAKQRLWFKWKSTTRWKRKNYDLHNIPGFYILFIALFISLTGLVMGFGWFSNTVKLIANGGKELPAEQRAVSDTTNIIPVANLQDIYAHTLMSGAICKKLVFVFPEEKEATLTVRAYQNEDNSIKQNIFFYDRYSGKLLKTRAYEKLSMGDKVNMANYDIHVGKILGLPAMILAFIASLVAASLPITGFYIWWEEEGNEIRKLPH